MRVLRDAHVVVTPAPFRSILDDFTFEFLQGGIEHQRGDNSLFKKSSYHSDYNKGMSYLHTMNFAESQRYQWMNVLAPREVVDAELDLLRIAAEDGPFDGILAFSQGSQMAAQTLIRHARLNPFATAEEKPFRFAVFVNGVTPGDAFEVPEGSTVLDLSEISDLMKLILHLNAPEVKKTPGLRIERLPDGREALTNDGFAYTKCDYQREGVLIDIPTLHIRCPKDTYDSEGLFQLCEPELRKELFHAHGHDFPRGSKEMNEIARLIRATAELAV
ncbi:Hydrolase FUB4 [Lachnellula suecica]|uniref:Hydrolase FUB4 n=1 Tax=Lachnellula suecica TaxID=602035 RepID=A0A8T9CL07_9HELO|nr:Hydrolase FUB4 [Lachnellula suecica]